MVTEVDPNGLASDQGFKTGDVILEVGGKKVANPADVRNALSEAQKDGKRTMLMRVKSGEGRGSSRCGSPKLNRMGRTAGIRRPRRRFEPGGRALGPSPAHLTPFRHPSPPPVLELVEGRRVQNRRPSHFSRSPRDPLAPVLT